MTVIVAVAKSNEIWIGADSFWGGCYHVSATKDTKKLIPLGNSVIGIAGLSVVRDIVQEMAIESDWENYQVVDKPSARKLGIEFHRRIKEAVERGTAKNKEQNQEDAEFIIASPHGIFKVYHDLSCFGPEPFVSKGAGWELARGAYEVATKLWSNPEKIVKTCIEAACTASPLCALPIDIIKIC